MDEFLENFVKNKELKHTTYDKNLDPSERKLFYEKCDIYGLYHKYINMNKRKCIIVYKEKVTNPKYNCLIQYIKEFNYPIMPLDINFVQYSLKKYDPYSDCLKTYNNIFKPLILALGEGNINQGLQKHQKNISDIKDYVAKKISENETYKLFIKNSSNNLEERSFQPSQSFSSNGSSSENRLCFWHRFCRKPTNSVLSSAFGKSPI